MLLILGVALNYFLLLIHGGSECCGCQNWGVDGGGDRVRKMKILVSAQLVFLIFRSLHIADFLSQESSFLSKLDSKIRQFLLIKCGTYLIC